LKMIGTPARDKEEGVGIVGPGGEGTLPKKHGNRAGDERATSGRDWGEN